MIPIGKRLGRYEVVAPLGAGGMGEVYRARDTRLERLVAVKVLPSGFAEDSERVARFEREAKALAALSHPNILTIHDFGKEQETFFVVTELLDGQTLGERISESAIPWREALTIANAIAEGLAAAHSQGIIHRDLKPQNLFLTSDNRVKILDFGLARIETPVSPFDETTTYVERLTGSNTIVGTVGYMSPEQIRGFHLDARTDIFSFGCVLFEMVTGQRAFRRATRADTMAATLNGELTGSWNAAQKLTEQVQEIIAECLAIDPAKRIPSAEQFLKVLNEIAVRFEPVPSSGIDVLLIEESKFNCRLAEALLTKDGHTWIAVNSHEEAILIARQKAFDIVLMQMQPTDCGPFAAAAAIRSHQADLGTYAPIIAMTTDPELRRRCKNRGMQGCIARPIDAAELRRTIDRYTVKIDLASVIETLDGDFGLLKELFADFCAEYHRHVDAIHSAINERDYGKLYLHSHRLRGTLRILAAQRAFELAKDLEDMSISRDLSEASTVLQSLKREIIRFRSATERYLEARSP